MKTLVDIPHPIIEQLTEISRQEKKSRSEIIRQALALFLKSTKAKQKRPNLFGIWKNRKTDSLAYEDKLRNEWR
ncbi:MAG: ribbon-helix-helix protein, CopG family [Deltaproteobacteria bacterium]|nr:ribbon-helix-helix protein, CopG family [Deltaproteobacteria bacterium]